MVCLRCAEQRAANRRVLIARGRDAVDVAITTTFGPNTLAGFTVVCEEVAKPI